MLGDSSSKEKRVLADYSFIGTVFVAICGLLIFVATLLILITVLPDKGQRDETLETPSEESRSPTGRVESEGS